MQESIQRAAWSRGGPSTGLRSTWCLTDHRRPVLDLVHRARQARNGCEGGRANPPTPPPQNPLFVTPGHPTHEGGAGVGSTRSGAERPTHPAARLDVGTHEAVYRAALGVAWADFLSREPWHWFATLTFSPSRWIMRGGKRIEIDRYHPLRGVHPEAAMKSWRWFMHETNNRLYGKHWKRRGDGGLVWVCGQEFHKSGKVHFHALVGAPDRDLNANLSRYEMHELWYREFGRNKIEQPTCQGDVARYVSKYVAKDGEILFSPNFGAVRTLPIFESEPAVWQARSQS